MALFPCNVGSGGTSYFEKNSIVYGRYARDTSNPFTTTDVTNYHDTWTSGTSKTIQLSTSDCFFVAVETSSATKMQITNTSPGGAQLLAFKNGSLVKMYSCYNNTVTDNSYDADLLVFYQWYNYGSATWNLTLKFT